MLDEQSYLRLVISALNINLGSNQFVGVMLPVLVLLVLLPVTLFDMSNNSNKV